MSDEERRAYQMTYLKYHIRRALDLHIPIYLLHDEGGKGLEKVWLEVNEFIDSYFDNMRKEIDYV